MEQLTAADTAPRSARAFTLIEVMLALSLLAIGALSLGAIQLMTIDYGGRGKHATQAGIIAQDTVDRLQRVRWTDASIQPTGGAWSGPKTVDVKVQDGGATVEHSYDVYVRVSDAVPGVSRNVDVRVDWTDPNRPPHRFAVSTMRYNIEGL